jgi:hypothetical protein
LRLPKAAWIVGRLGAPCTSLGRPLVRVSSAGSSVLPDNPGRRTASPAPAGKMRGPGVLISFFAMEPDATFANLVGANLAQHPAFRTSGSDPCATKSQLNRSGISSRKQPKPRLKSFPTAKSAKHSSERPGSYELPPKSINGFHRRSLSRRSKTAAVGTALC